MESVGLDQFTTMPMVSDVPRYVERAEFLLHNMEQSADALFCKRLRQAQLDLRDSMPFTPLAQRVHVATKFFSLFDLAQAAYAANAQKRIPPTL